MGHKGKSVHLSTQHWVDDTRIMMKECQSLASDGWQVTYICHAGQKNVPDLPRNIAVHMIDLPNRNMRDRLRIIKAVCDILRKGQADIYHFHDPELIPVGLLLKLTTRAKIIYDVHENVGKQILNKAWLPLWIRKPLSWGYILIERACLPFIDKIIIAEDSYTENYQGRKNIVAIRNYPILPYLGTYADTVTGRAKEANHSFKVTYVGGVTRLRGVLELIEAFKIIKMNGHQQVKLDLIGPIMPPTLKGELDSLIRQYGLEENVSVSGPIPYERIYTVLSQSHVGLAILHPDPNYVESLPTKLFEYMAVGLPVIASNFPLWKEIVEGNECGLTVNPLNPKEIAGAIEYLLSHPAEAKQMGENGRRAVMEKYNWEREAEKLLAVYKDLLGGDE